MANWPEQKAPPMSIGSHCLPPNMTPVPPHLVSPDQGGSGAGAVSADQAARAGLQHPSYASAEIAKNTGLYRLPSSPSGAGWLTARTDSSCWRPLRAVHMIDCPAERPSRAVPIGVTDLRIDAAEGGVWHAGYSFGRAVGRVQADAATLS